MKNIILAVILALASLSVSAQHHGRHHGGHNNWVAPLIVGGAIGYALTRPPVVYAYAAPPVYVAPVYVEPRDCRRIIIRDDWGRVVHEEIRCY